MLNINMTTLLQTEFKFLQLNSLSLAEGVFLSTVEL